MTKARYENYESLANKKGVSNYRVSKETNVSQETLSKWKNGKYTPKDDKIRRLADYFNVPVDYFYTSKLGDEEKEKLNMLIEVSAGKGRINDCYERVNDSIDVTICGDSMYPVLQDGDIVEVVPATDTVPTDLTVVKINGEECTVKYVELTATGIWLRAENKDVFEDKFYSVQECLTLPVQIIGKAVKLVSRDL